MRDRRLAAERRAKWEDGFFAAIVLVFCVSSIVNFGGTLSPHRDVSVFGSCCSYLYLALWFAAAVVLRNRKGWAWTAFAVRWATIAAVCLTAFLVHRHLDIQYEIFAVLAYLPYGALLPVYGGIHSRFFHSGWFYVLPAAQAIISTGLLIRVKRREKAPEASN